MFPRSFSDSPDGVALVLEPSGETRSYAELQHRARQAASLFVAHGIVPGDRVAFCLENCLDVFDFCWGAHIAGMDYVAISSRLRTGEVEYILRDSGATLLLGSEAISASLPELAANNPSVTILSLGPAQPGIGSWRPILEQQSPLDAPRALLGRPMFYSSGTTGRPKGIVKAGGQDEAAQEALPNLMRTLLGVANSSAYLCPAPLYHSAPLNWTMAMQRVGGLAVVMEHFSPELTLSLIEKHRITQAQFVPTHFVRMLKLQDAQRARFDHRSLRAVIHAAAPCPIEIKRQMIEWWGPIIHEYYAGSESNGLTFISAEDWLKRPGTVGKAIIGNVHICAEDGQELPPRSEGLIYFEGGPEFSYHNDETKTAGSRNPFGWTTLGDIGWVDEEGYLYLTDRKDFMIISGGVNIYPQEIENLLIEHPKVADAAVIGGPDPDMGEKVVAFVQLRPGQSLDDNLAQELHAYCRQHLSSIKAPRQYEFVTELPRAATGKLYKRELRDRLWSAFDQGTTDSAGESRRTRLFGQPHK